MHPFIDLLSRCFTLALTLLAVGFFLSRLAAWGKKLKLTKEIPPDVIQDLKTRTFPRYYAVLYALWLIGYLVIFCGGVIVFSFWSSNWFFGLQISLFGKDAIYFYSLAPDVIVLLMLFGTPGLWGLLSWVLLSTIPPSKRFKDYVLALQIKQWGPWEFDAWAFTKFVMQLTIAYCLLISPVVYLALHSHTTVFPDRVVHHPFWGFTEHVSRFEDVARLEASYKETDSDVSPSVLLLLTNGKKLDLTPSSMPPWRANADVPNLYAVLRKNNVPVQIQSLSEAEINRIQSSFVPAKQQVLFTIFELDRPVEF